MTFVLCSTVSTTIFVKQHLTSFLCLFLPVCLKIVMKCSWCCVGLNQCLIFTTLVIVGTKQTSLGAENLKKRLLFLASPVYIMFVVEMCWYYSVCRYWHWYQYSLFCHYWYADTNNWSSFYPFQYILITYLES